MPFDDYPDEVRRVFQGIQHGSRYDLRSMKTRIQLKFDGRRIGGWADDSSGPHWYILNGIAWDREPPWSILAKFGFRTMVRSGGSLYFRREGTEGGASFRRAVEMITGSPIS